MKKALICLSAVLFTATAWAKEANVTLEVPSMSCAACPITVQKALENVDGVSKAEVDMTSKSAVVTYDDAKTSAIVLADATKNAGYPSTIKSPAAK